jgi:hypothetical protein
MKWITPRSSRQGGTPATDDLSSGNSARGQAARLSGLSRSDLVRWHVCDMATGPDDVRFQGKSGSERQAGKAALLTVRPEGANYQ